MKTWNRTVAIGWAMGVASIIGLGTMPAQATEGYFQHGYGIVSKVLAGTGAAYSQDAMSQALNPAGLVDVRNQVNVGVAFFSPRRKYTASGTSSPGAFIESSTGVSSSNLFIIPDAAASYKIDDVSAVGVALYGNGGMNTDYDDDIICAQGIPGVFCEGTAGVDLTQLFVQATYARKFFDRVSVGGGPYSPFRVSKQMGSGYLPRFRPIQIT